MLEALLFSKYRRKYRKCLNLIWETKLLLFDQNCVHHASVEWMAWQCWKFKELHSKVEECRHMNGSMKCTGKLPSWQRAYNYCINHKDLWPFGPTMLKAPKNCPAFSRRNLWRQKQCYVTFIRKCVGKVLQ